MPGRNIVKIDIQESFYHVYANGRGRQKIFRDENDYNYFLDLFERYLLPNTQSNPNGLKYPHFRKRLQLLSYSLMPRHFHLMLYQVEQGVMPKLMRAVMTSYTMYFNKKYHLSGSLFATTYKASRMPNDESLKQVSRYIHLDAGDWQAHPYSSIHAWFGVGRPEWLQPERLIEKFESLPHYADFLDDKKDYSRVRRDFKSVLANNIKK